MPVDRQDVRHRKGEAADVSERDRLSSSAITRLQMTSYMTFEIGTSYMTFKIDLSVSHENAVFLYLMMRRFQQCAEASWLT
jgi:hypothetical protein